MKAKFLFQGLLVVIISCNHYSSAYFPRQFYSRVFTGTSFCCPQIQMQAFTLEIVTNAGKVNTHSPSPGETELLPAVKDSWPFPGECQVPMPLKTQFMV